MDSHHTEAEIQAAFQKAPGILKELVELGADLPVSLQFCCGLVNHSYTGG